MGNGWILVVKNSFGEKYFDGEHSGYKNGYNLKNKLLKITFKNQISKIKKFQIKKALKIWDIGCAYGYFLNYCEKNGWTLYGSDISSHAIDKAKKLTTARLKVNNIEEKSPFNIKFDVITCFEVLEHLNNPDKAIENVYESLDTDGIFLMSTPNPRSYGYRRLFLKFEDSDKTHISLYNKKYWEKLLKSNNFHILSSNTVIYNEASDRKMAKLVLISKLLSSLGLGFTTEIVAIKKGKNDKNHNQNY